MQNFVDFIKILNIILIAVISLPIHEFAHGFCALKLGDSTAKKNGRLTLNPLKHFDLLGMLSMIFLHVGWAKAVPINMNNFKKPKQSMAIVALVGPLSNFCLALIGMFVLKILDGCFNISNLFEADNLIFSIYIYSFLKNFIFVNIGLASFNLIPIPPLDGSRLILYFLPDNAYYYVLQNEGKFSIVLFMLLLTNILNRPLIFLNDMLLTICKYIVNIF